jgi:hypothetical protein
MTVRIPIQALSLFILTLLQAEILEQNPDRISLRPEQNGPGAQSNNSSKRLD